MTVDEMDVDMAGEVERDTSFDSDKAIVVEQYIVVDTNILIGDFALLKTLFDVLSIRTLPRVVHLLIPSIVTHELDNIQKSDRVEIRNQAREAMRYLLRHVVARRTDPAIPLRVQKQSEVLRADLSKPDDRILDCCLKFKPACKDIWLWSKDLNLNFNAESNDVRMLSSYSLNDIARCLEIDHVPEVEGKVQRWRRAMIRGGDDPPQTDDGGMELDEDFLVGPLSTHVKTTSAEARVQQHTGLPSFTLDAEPDPSGPGTPSTDSALAAGPDGSRSLLNDYIARWSPQLALPDMPLSPPSTGLSTPTRLSLYDHHDRLGLAIHPLLAHLGVTYERSDRYLTALLDKLLMLERSIFPDDAPPRAPTDNERSVLVSISAARTLVKYFEQDLYGRNRHRERRPRTGEAADAIEVLGELCDASGLESEVRTNMDAVAAGVRDS